MDDLWQLKERIGQELARTRENAGISQKEMAKKMGLSLPTIQKYEYSESVPDYLKILQWYDICGKNPEAGLRNVLYPSVGKLSEQTEYEVVKQKAVGIIEQQDIHTLLAIIYILNADHGSAVYPLIQLLLCYAQNPIGNKQFMAPMIVHGYEVAKAMGQLPVTDAPEPNVDIVKEAIKQGTLAFQKGMQGYTTVLE